MSLILNIDTSLETASVSIAREGKIDAMVTNGIQKEHASFLHVAIADLCKQASVELSRFDAVAVTKGPGSYTGLRVGMAAAKGLCYALNKPFITVSTLEAIALSEIELSKKSKYDWESALYAPMIDARRMEVFTAIYDENLNEILSPTAMVLNENSYSAYLEKKIIFFCGNGAAKFAALPLNANAFFGGVSEIATAISILSHRSFITQQFTELAHSEPLYIKEFYDGK